MGFARYLDVKQPSLARWMAGDNPPTGENIIKLAEKLGPEIYYILGLPRPDAGEEALIKKYRSIPPEMREKFSDALREFVAEWAANHGYERD